MTTITNIADVKRPDSFPEADWLLYVSEGFGTCAKCGEVAHTSFSDILEATKPEDKVINYKIIKVYYTCFEHARTGLAFMNDGTIEKQMHDDTGFPKREVLAL